MPPLLRANQLQKLAAKVGFDWPDLLPVWNKITEEIEECKEAVEQGHSKSLITGELGDILFAVVNLSRKLKVDPAIALESTNKKFIERFSFIETKVKENGQDLTDLSLEELDHFWELSKQKK